MNRFISTALLFCIILTVSSCVRDNFKYTDEVLNYVQVGDTIPAFTATNPQGEVFHSADLAGKRGVIVLFYSACSDCKRELPIIEEAWLACKDQPDFVLASFARDESKADYFTQNPHLTMPWYGDLNRSVFNLFANSYVPRIYLVNKQGRVAWMAIENFNIDAAELIRKINAL